MRQNMRENQAGFSLLELLIAVGILSAAAYVALDTVENNTGQRRYDLTELRLEKIRRAIVGTPGLVANGAPVISGFVADVGRLPDCLEALVNRTSTCGGATTDIPPAYAQFITAGTPIPRLYAGWRGPYLTAGGDGVADGWGTSAAGDVNWGWTVTPTGDEIDIASLGRDRASGATPAGIGTYDEDQGMSGIVSGDFRVSLASTSINIEMTNIGATDRNICLAILVPNPANANSWKLISISAPVPVLAGATQTVVFSSSDEVSIGLRTVIVYDSDDTSVGVACQASLTNDDLLNNALLGSAGLLFTPRAVPTGNLSFTL